MPFVEVFEGLRLQVLGVQFHASLTSGSVGEVRAYIPSRDATQTTQERMFLAELLLLSSLHF